MDFLHFPCEVPESACHFQRLKTDVTVKQFKSILIIELDRASFTNPMWHLVHNSNRI